MQSQTVIPVERRAGPGLRLVRALRAVMQRLTAVPSRSDVPEYLRRDVGLPPRSLTSRAADPPDRPRLPMM
ncbi:hypothetical protein HKCCE2091_12260 [Rhodobacterales bacterium HKCCE2091]|nr:hypothetical protein [Rhodobacterales bacterium HKCCE2091]